ncbi:hypothetical protein MTR67_001570, partial [Solanum verrucosum]
KLEVGEVHYRCNFMFASRFWEILRSLCCDNSCACLLGSSILDLCVTTIQWSYQFGFDILTSILNANANHVSLRINFFYLLICFGHQWMSFLAVKNTWMGI